MTRCGGCRNSKPGPHHTCKPRSHVVGQEPAHRSSALAHRDGTRGCPVVLPGAGVGRQQQPARHGNRTSSRSSSRSSRSSRCVCMCWCTRLPRATTMWCMWACTASRMLCARVCPSRVALRSVACAQHTRHRHLLQQQPSTDTRHVPSLLCRGSVAGATGSTQPPPPPAAAAAPPLQQPPPQNLLAAEEDRYDGIIISPEQLPSDPQAFASALQQSLQVCLVGGNMVSSCASAAPRRQPGSDQAALTHACCELPPLAPAGVAAARQARRVAQGAPRAQPAHSRRSGPRRLCLPPR
jgi:hypothetical protein